MNYLWPQKLHTRLDATENADSEGTEVAGVHKYRFAKFFN